MESCSNPKKGVKSQYLKFFKVATLCLNARSVQSYHPLNQLYGGSHLECISINRCDLLKLFVFEPISCVVKRKVYRREPNSVKYKSIVWQEQLK
jgi:hypothetical protein